MLHPAIAQIASAALGLVSGSTATPGGGPADARRSASLITYLWEKRRETARLTLRHLLLVALSLGAGIVVAVPLGLGLERARARAEAAIRVIGLLQTVPSIALLAFMIPLLGIGVHCEHGHYQQSRGE